jgi:tetratricopeptide (TPR) repeat protein
MGALPVKMNDPVNGVTLMSASNQSISRYDPCPCGSGKKYKFCCEKKDRLNARRLLSPLGAILGTPIEEEEEGIDRVIAPDGEELLLLNYEITSEPMNEPGVESPPELEAEKAELYEMMTAAPHEAIPRLERLIEQYPAIPSLKNWLMVAYQQAGRRADSDAMSERAWREHPDYLFGRIARAYDYLNRGELDKVPEVLGGLDLKLIYPHRNVFHVSEAISLWALLAHWCYRRGEDDEALDHLERMVDLDPEHALTERTELLLMPLVIKKVLSRMSEHRPRKRVKAKAKHGGGKRAGKRQASLTDDVAAGPPRNAC